MGRQQVEQDPLVVELHLLHVMSLLLRLRDAENENTHKHEQKHRDETDALPTSFVAPLSSKAAVMAYLYH